MAEQPATPPPAAAQGTEPVPQLTVTAQYVKDLSFENPRAPISFTEARSGPPNVEINVDVAARRLQERTFEVVLAIRAKANSSVGPLFLAEVEYAGLFAIGNVPQEAVEPLLLIQAPLLLFPFARAIIADGVREGGFAPLMVQPIDFIQLYRQRRAKEGAAATNGSGGAQSDGTATA